MTAVETRRSDFTPRDAKGKEAASFKLTHYPGRRPVAHRTAPPWYGRGMLTDDNPGPRIVHCRCGWRTPAAGLCEAARLLLDHVGRGCSADDLLIVPAGAEERRRADERNAEMVRAWTRANPARAAEVFRAWLGARRATYKWNVAQVPIPGQDDAQAEAALKSRSATP